MLLRVNGAMPLTRRVRTRGAMLARPCILNCCNGIISLYLLDSVLQIDHGSPDLVLPARSVAVFCFAYRPSAKSQACEVIPMLSLFFYC